MGMMGGLARASGAVATLGRAAQGLSEVFVPNATQGQALAHAAQKAALEQLGAEFALPKRGLFDRVVDGLNRLPRPLLALGTLGLFVYAMAEPVGFAARMEGLGYVPDPLWWLLGAIVGFYFGAREFHYLRRPSVVGGGPRPGRGLFGLFRRSRPGRETRDEDNPALMDWRAGRGDGA